MSLDTVHRLLEPPRKGTIASRYYYGLVAARVPHKCNNVVKEHVDIHYCRVAVKLFCEMFVQFRDETLLLSVDDMNKLNVGVTAVSRYHQLNKFFLSNDSPNTPDHDFPEYMVLEGKTKRHGRSVVPGGSRMRSLSFPSRPSGRSYQTSSQRSRSLSPQRSNESEVSGRFVRDKIGRIHFRCPKTGRHFIFLRAVRYHPSNAMNHANDLHQILSREFPKKKAVGIISDGGPDWSIKSLHNLYIYGRLWYDLNLDYLGITQHAPGNSKENPIEHAWAPRARNLSSVILQRRVQVDDEISAEELDKLSFDKAVESACSYWRGRTFDTFPGSPIPVLSEQKPSPYDDFDKVKMFV